MSKKLIQALNSTLAKIGKDGQGSSQSNPKRKSWRAARQAMARRSNASRVPRGILAGYGSAVTASFYQSRRGDGEIVRGFDLITSPFDPTVLSNPNISYFITANPASWNGTRIAAIAAGYQNYRPLMFKIHYRPQVGSTSQISMFIGTIWQNNYVTSRVSLEPTLVTSPGGTYLPAWQSCCSVVPLGRRLPQRMYPVRDPEFTTVPFSVVCRASNGGPESGAVTMPGRIFVEYAYEFRNAIGSGVGFQPSAANLVTGTRTTLYNGTTNLGVALVASTTEESSSGFANTGWIIDVGAPAGSGVIPSYISTATPIFVRMDTDEVIASPISGGTAERLPIIQFNGTAPDASTFNTTTCFVTYTDNGRPT